MDDPRKAWTCATAIAATLAAVVWLVVQAHAPRETITDPSKNPKRHVSVARR